MDHLDVVFLQALTDIQSIYSALPERALQIRVEKWCAKLAEECLNPAWRANRNHYALLLLQAVRTKCFEGRPFDRGPPDGPLEKLLPHQILMLGTATGTPPGAPFPGYVPASVPGIDPVHTAGKTKAVPPPAVWRKWDKVLDGVSTRAGGHRWVPDSAPKATATTGGGGGGDHGREGRQVRFTDSTVSRHESGASSSGAGGRAAPSAAAPGHGVAASGAGGGSVTSYSYSSSGSGDAGAWDRVPCLRSSRSRERSGSREGRARPPSSSGAGVTAAAESFLTTSQMASIVLAESNARANAAASAASSGGSSKQQQRRGKGASTAATATGDRLTPQLAPEQIVDVYGNRYVHVSTARVVAPPPVAPASQSLVLDDAEAAAAAAAASVRGLGEVDPSVAASVIASARLEAEALRGELATARQQTLDATAAAAAARGAQAAAEARAAEAEMRAAAAEAQLSMVREEVTRAKRALADVKRVAAAEVEAVKAKAAAEALAVRRECAERLMDARWYTATAGAGARAGGGAEVLAQLPPEVLVSVELPSPSIAAPQGKAAGGGLRYRPAHPEAETGLGASVRSAASVTYPGPTAADATRGGTAAARRARGTVTAGGAVTAGTSSATSSSRAGGGALRPSPRVPLTAAIEPPAFAEASLTQTGLQLEAEEDGGEPLPLRSRRGGAWEELQSLSTASGALDLLEASRGGGVSTPSSSSSHRSSLSSSSLSVSFEGGEGDAAAAAAGGAPLAATATSGLSATASSASSALSASTASSSSSTSSHRSTLGALSPSPAGRGEALASPAHVPQVAVEGEAGPPSTPLPPSRARGSFNFSIPATPSSPDPLNSSIGSDLGDGVTLGLGVPPSPASLARMNAWLSSKGYKRTNQRFKSAVNAVTAARRFASALQAFGSPGSPLGEGSGSPRDDAASAAAAASSASAASPAASGFGSSEGGGVASLSGASGFGFPVLPPSEASVVPPSSPPTLPLWETRVPSPPTEGVAPQAVTTAVTAPSAPAAPASASGRYPSAVVQATATAAAASVAAAPAPPLSQREQASPSRGRHHRSRGSESTTAPTLAPAPAASRVKRGRGLSIEPPPAAPSPATAPAVAAVGANTSFEADEARVGDTLLVPKRGVAPAGGASGAAAARAEHEHAPPPEATARAAVADHQARVSTMLHAIDAAVASVRSSGSSTSSDAAAPSSSSSNPVWNVPVVPLPDASAIFSSATARLKLQSIASTLGK